MKKENLQQLIKEAGFILATLVLFPLSLGLYLLDRIVCVVLIHLENKALNVWQKDINNVIQSLYRVVGAGVILALIKLILWIL